MAVSVLALWLWQQCKCYDMLLPDTPSTLVPGGPVYTGECRFRVGAVMAIGRWLAGPMTGVAAMDSPHRSQGLLQCSGGACWAARYPGLQAWGMVNSPLIWRLLAPPGSWPWWRWEPGPCLLQPAQGPMARCWRPRPLWQLLALIYPRLLRLSFDQSV